MKQAGGDGGEDVIYQLFAYNQCSNPHIGLTLAWNDAKKMWTIQHVLFLLNSSIKSTYTMECVVRVCDKDSDSVCSYMADGCVGSLVTKSPIDLGD